ncbi:MAG: hypothetical protein E7588_05555 [Ruminococcaceae bacterium]|nr:hypothetical protein [Oscillospiraceae bacterium]
MISEKGTIFRITAQKPCEGFCAEIKNTDAKSCKWCVTDSMGNTKISGQADAANGEITVKGVFDALPWSAQEPVLYTLGIELSNGEKLSDRFGFRYFSCDERYIYLNGFPFYMRAYIRGAAAHEHQNNCGLSEFEFYKKNIITAKSYGFNAIRFHSVIPPKACFDAADELGMLIHIETRAEGHEDYNNLEEMLYGKDNLITNEGLMNVINTNFNHPSLMVYCIGNELRHPGTKPRIREIGEFIKKNDPTRLYIDTCAHGEYDRDTVDFDVQHMGYFFPYAKHADMFSDTANLLCFGNVRDCDMVVEKDNTKIRRSISFNRPLIAHEVCHYTAWRDFYALKEKFERYGVKAPWWVDEEIKMLEAKGYKDDFAHTLQVTKNFQFRCWKTAIEGIRRSELLSGFHMLQFADTDKYENSNGVVDCFDDYQGISPEAFCDFNGDTVVLAKLEDQILSAGQKVKIPIILSQYKIAPPETATFTFEMKGESGKVYAVGELTLVDTAKSGIYEICVAEIELPEIDTAEKVTFTVRLDMCDGSVCKNSWELWIFPECAPKAAAQNRLTGNYPIEFADNSDYVVTDTLDDVLLNDLENGKNVLLIYRTDWTRHLLHKDMKAPKYSFRHVWERFKGVIWDRGTINGGTDDTALLRKYGFPSYGEVNFHYYPLIEDSDKINLDDFPVKVHSIVAGLDKSSRDRFDPKKFKLPELMYDRTMRHFSYAFEVSVGKGKLLVTGMNFTEGKNPAVRCMLSALLTYWQSADFKPEASISVSDFAKYLSDVAAEGPQKERMMTQYWQYDSEPVESMDYWTEAERYLKEE